MENVIHQKEGQIREVLKSQGMVSSRESGGNIGDHDQVLEAAYEQFCRDLHQVGIPEAAMPLKEKVLELLRSRGIGASSQIGGGRNGDKGSSSGDKGQLLEAA